MEAFTLNHTILTLKEPPFCAGGEGAVYEIAGFPNKVAKIYHDASDAKKREAKIMAMVAISSSYPFQKANMSADIAWPLSPLYDKNHSFIGFGMNRIHAGMELDDLYVYPPKQNAHVTTRNKVACLIHLCGIIERLHQIGQVFGDFNPNNIKIEPDWSVRFVDADSYHIKSGGKEYRCTVCAPGYVAPELIRACKGTTYGDCPGTTFTKETDRFALAIHIFRMLMNGCHPFTCERHQSHIGSTKAPLSIDKRVERGETPFFQTIPNHTPPQFAPDIHAFPPYLKALFRRAFVDGHHNPSARPDASEWKKALMRYSGDLKECGVNHRHYYWNGSAVCPYCEADQRYSRKIKSTMVPAKAAYNNTKVGGYSPTLRPFHPIPAAPIRSKPPLSRRFLLATIATAIIMEILLGRYVLPDIYTMVFHSKTLTAIGMIGSMIAGIVGGALYDCRWSSRLMTGAHFWREYLLSILTALGFTAGFGVAMCLMILVLYIAAYFFIAVFLLAILVGAFSGG